MQNGDGNWIPLNNSARYYNGTEVRFEGQCYIIVGEMVYPDPKVVVSPGEKNLENNYTLGTERLSPSTQEDYEAPKVTLQETSEIYGADLLRQRRNSVDESPKEA